MELIITEAQRMSSDYLEQLRSWEHLRVVSGAYPKEKFSKVFKYTPEKQWAMGNASEMPIGLKKKFSRANTHKNTVTEGKLILECG